MNSPGSGRPPLTANTTGAEFLRWYWLKDELSSFARAHGLKATGSKQLLTARIAAALDGTDFAEPAPPQRQSGIQLSEPLFHATPIPAGQRCSQILRRWLSEQIGPAFHFDAAMRAYLAGADGTQTLSDAVDHWHNTRNPGRKTIGPQFEFNRFTRQWHAAHPDGTRDQLRSAWNLYRSRPVDERDTGTCRETAGQESPSNKRDRRRPGQGSGPTKA